MADLNVFLLGFFAVHPLLMSFLVPLFFGEAGFVLLAFAVGLSDFTSLFTLLLLGTLADIIGDVFWFQIVRYKSLRRLKILKSLFKKIEKMESRFKEAEQKNLFSFILGSKFLVGTRLFAVVSVSLNKVKFRKFLFVSVVSGFLWSLVIVSLGWLAGRGVLKVAELFNGARAGLTILIVVAVVIVLARKFMHHHTSGILIRKKVVKNVS